MRRMVLALAALVFVAGLFLDTAGVIELSWLCVSGRCGLPVRFVLPGLGMLLAGGALLLGPPSPPVKGKAKRKAKTRPAPGGGTARQAKTK